MSETNETNEPETNVEGLKEEALACGPGCGCNAGSSGRGRWVLGTIIIVITGVLVARAVMKDDNVSAQKLDAAFVTMTDGAAGPEAPDDAPKAVSHAAPTVAEDKQEKASVVCGESIGSLGDLNKKAMDKDGVFVFLAGMDAGKNSEVASIIEKGAATLRGRNLKIGVFTIEEGTSEYINLAKQVAPPCVIAMVKGRGTSAVSDDITESKLVQAYVAASSAGGACCPGGTSSAACN